MKNFKLFLLGLIILFFSLAYTNEMSMYQITPSFLLPWVIYISIRLEYKVCVSYAFFFSLANELFNPQLLGFTTILYVLITHFTNLYHESFNKEKVSTIIVSLFCLNIAFYTIQWLYFSFSSQEPWFLLQKTGITIIYSTVTSCAILFVLYFVDKLKISFHA
ncbi:MAG: hypothetical protein FWG20_06160 [Candidatus Cloacimonetes bacterium]|nr:hypothetical protein [Candidatus Cloacimonadota bacterium]